MDLNADQSTFYPQTTTSMSGRRRSSSAPILTLPILIIILPIIALILLFIVIFPFLAITSQIFRPYNNNTVKKSWDSLNLFLVLFAIFCGILARRNDDKSNSDTKFNNGSNISDSMDKNRQPFSHHQWFDPPLTTPARGTGRLRRNSSSYPDLRQDALWETGDDRFRFFDDFDIQQKYYCSDDVAAANELDNNYAHQLRRSDFEGYSQVNNFVLHSSPVPPTKSPTPTPSPSPSPPSPPPPPPPPAVRQKPRRTYQTDGRKERNVESDVNSKKVQSSTPPPPPPPPPVQTRSRSEQKYVKIESRKSNATKELKMVFATLYNQRKRIKKKYNTKNNMNDYDKFVNSTPEYSTIPPPPPPPPPPRPPSVFHNLFRKNRKSKKVHDVHPTPPPPAPPRLPRRKSHSPRPPPPPPPPPPLPRTPSVFQNLFKKNRKSKKVHDVHPPPPPPPPPPAPPRLSRRKSHSPPPPPPPGPPTPPRRNNGKPPLPTSTRANNNRLYDENIDSINCSPLIPPPPPPFKIAEFKFVLGGDFVSIHSSHSSRCSTPELGEIDGDGDDDDAMSSKEKSNVMNGGDAVSSTTFCPSPDVNVKADCFIARLRDEWRLEKINSIREKQKL